MCCEADMSELFPIELNEPVAPNDLYTVRADYAAGLGFELTVPRRLQGQPCEALARLAGEDRDDLCVEVSVRAIDRELHPADLLDAELEENGAQVLERRIMPSPNGYELDVLYMDASGTISRTRTLRDGNRLFEVTGSAPKEHFPNVAADAFLALAGFRLLDPVGGTHVEQRLKWKEKQPQPIEFEYPESWEVMPVVQDDDLLALEITSEYQQSLTGRIQIEVHQAVPGVDALSILKSFSDSLKDLGAHLSGAPVVPAPPLPGFQQTRLYTPRVTFHDHQFDSPVLLLESPAAVIVLALLGTAKDHSPHWWAINKRAFEIVRDSLHAGDVGESSGATNG
jgi:hypothetical protein